jgi:protein SCO1/2
MSRSLAESVGFNYYFDAKRNEYAHPAVAFLISPNGKITRYLYGINYRQFDLKLALIEASEGKIGTTIDRIILSCFHYDPKLNSYVPFAINIMKFGGFLTIVVMGVILGTFWVKESRKHERKGKPPVDLTLN